MFFQKFNSFLFICVILFVYIKCNSITREHYEQKLKEIRLRQHVWKNNIAMLKTKIRIKKEELDKLMPMLALRRKIEVYESLTSLPELSEPYLVFGHPLMKNATKKMYYHEARWYLTFFNPKSEVQELREVLRRERIKDETFCRIMDSFFLIPPIYDSKMFYPTLSMYRKKQLYNIMRNNYQIDDEDVLRCIIDVLGNV